MRILRILVPLLPGLCVLLAGCASVPPWERGNLAQPQMAFDLNPAQGALRAHAYSSREAAMNADAAAGGGCGCY
jgi:starvation-inducible outer membrane lipoprotein